MSRSSAGRRHPRYVVGLLTLLLTTVAGCGGIADPEFTLNMQGLDPHQFVVTSDDDEEQEKYKQQFIDGQQNIATALTAMFGTPDEPYVFAESGLDLNKINMAAGPAFDPQGQQHGLYRLHCVHCHGITGDGAGPTAAFLNPYPRDYRRGIFKFKSTQRSAKPTQADLVRILKDGIHGTAMPSFVLLPDDEIEALVEYVKYLTIRGECEQAMNFIVYSQEEPLEMTHDYLVEQVLQPVVLPWQEADTKVIVPGDAPDVSTPELLASSLTEGAKLFNGKAQCAKCHGPTAMGDGETLFDDWNKDKLTSEAIDKKYHDIVDDESLTGEERDEKLAGFYDELDKNETWRLPPQQLKPRNLRMGIYRFGRSPADLYRRIDAGINGTPMPGGFLSPGNPNNLQPQEIWHLVNYVRSLPYEPMSQPYGSLKIVNEEISHDDAALRAKH